MKRCMTLLFSIALFFYAAPAFAVPVQFSAEYVTGPVHIDGVRDELVELTYNAYYDSDAVITTYSGVVENVGGDIFEGYSQTAQLDYWELYLGGDLVTTETGGSLFFYNDDPAFLKYFSADEGLTYAEIGGWGDPMFGLTTPISLSIGSDLFTSVGDSSVGTISGTIGIGTAIISQVSSVPEPSVVLLLISGFFGLGIMQKKRT